MFIVTITPTAPFLGAPVPRLFAGEDEDTVRNESVRASRAAEAAPARSGGRHAIASDADSGRTRKTRISVPGGYQGKH